MSIYSAIGLVLIWLAGLVCPPWVFATTLRPYLNYHSVDGVNIQVTGLYGFDYSQRLYHRLNTSLEVYRPGIVDLAKRPKGGRIRFRTDSKQLHVASEILNSVEPPTGWSLAAAHGIDTYVNKRFYITTVIEKDGVINLPEPPKDSLNSVELYLPPYLELKIDQIGLTPNSTLTPPPELGKRVVFYGTSIEWGGGGSRAALTYPEMVTRDLDLDFYNFSFPALAWGEDEVTETLAKVPCDLFVLSYTRNVRADALAYTGMTYQENLVAFVSKIKKYQPGAKVIIVSSLYLLTERYDKERAVEENAKRQAAVEACEILSQSYDGIYLVDGKKLPSHYANDDAFSEAGHPTALGHRQIANELKPLIERILSE